MNNRLRVTLAVGALFLVLFAASCSSGESPEPTVGPTEVTVTATVITEAHRLARRAWDQSPHADTYALEKGPNTYCAKCHSPANWDPNAEIDDPPNCVSCKFASEEEPRIAEGNPLVPESEWESIGCDVCHRVEDGAVEPEVAWRDRITGYYETVPNSTALCEKCHRDTEALAHERHLGTAHAGLLCTDCHDPHSTAADCLAAGCHEDIAVAPGELPAGNAGAELHVRHKEVACHVCHARPPVTVKRREDGRWVTVRTVDLLGRKTVKEYVAHNLQRSVPCDRCHYPGNPWQLVETVEDEP